jgi:hypothetical protein
MSGQTNNTQAAKQADVTQATDAGNGHELQHDHGKDEKISLNGKIKNLGGNLKKHELSLATIGTLAAIVTGVTAGVIGLNQYFSEQPNLSINVETISFQPDISWEEIIRKLVEIETANSRITGDAIVNSITEIENLLEKQKTSSEKTQKQLVDEVNTSLGKALEKLNEYQQSYLQGDEKINIKGAVKAVEQIRNSITVNKTDNPNQKNKVSIDLLIENQSRLQNGLYKTAVITFYKDKKTTLPITLQVQSIQDSENTKDSKNTEDNSIDDHSFKRFQLKSSTIASLTPTHQEFITSAFANEYPYILVVKDISGKIWTLEDKALSFNIDKTGEELKQETLKIIEKKE